MSCSTGSELLNHVPEVLDMPTLVRGNRDALHVLLERRLNDLVDTSVMPQMDDLSAGCLKDTPNDVDGGIVPVKQA